MNRKGKGKSTIPLVMMGLGALIIIGGATWYAIQLNWVSGADAIATSVIEENYPEIARVTLQDARAAYETGSAIFLDVRTADAYQQSHIPGALSIPLSDLPQQIGQLSKSTWIITY